MRRHNGVSAYHAYVSELLKKAKLKDKMSGKSKEERRKILTSAMRKAVAKAKEMAKAGFPEKYGKTVSEKNAKIKAAKAGRREKRAGKVTVRTARRRAGSASKYAALSAAERRALRMQPVSRKAASKAPSRKRRTSAKKAAPAASAKATRIVTTKKGKQMYYVSGKLVSKAAYEAAVGSAASAPAKKASKRRKAASKAKGAKRPASATKAAKANPRRRRSSKKGMRRSRRNPSFGGALAVVKEFGREAFTVQGIGGAALVGVAHGFVAPMVADYLANMFPQSYRVPVLDVEVSASSFAFTATGAVAGAALGLVGYLTGRPALGLGLGGLAFTSGLVIDTVGLVQSRGEAGSMGDVAYGAIDNDGMVYGDVAYGAIDNNGMVYGDVAYGDVAYGDVAYGGVMGEAGMSYGAACMSEYADAESADAADSGADFSEEEGQALMEGPLSWLRRFGRAPRRMTGIRGAKSRHAGRAGHRWGWLIKLVGMDKAAKIAALPPEKRLKVIAALRQQAVSSLSTLMAQHASTTTEATVAAANERVPAHLLLPPPPARPNLLPAPQAMGLDLMALGAGGAMGSGGYGTVMYAGGGF
jgi:hypothetical protein